MHFFSPTYCESSLSPSMNRATLYLHTNSYLEEEKRAFQFHFKALH